MTDHGYDDIADEIEQLSADLAKAYPCTLDDARRAIVSALNDERWQAPTGDTAT